MRRTPARFQGLALLAPIPTLIPTPILSPQTLIRSVIASHSRTLSGVDIARPDSHPDSHPDS